MECDGQTDGQTNAISKTLRNSCVNVDVRCGIAIWISVVLYRAREWATIKLQDIRIVQVYSGLLSVVISIKYTGKDKGP